MDNNEKLERFFSEYANDISQTDDPCLKQAISLLRELTPPQNELSEMPNLEQEIETVCRGIGHNFNGILANIRGTAEITQLKAPDLSEAAQQGLNTILTLSDRGEYSTEQIRLYGKALSPQKQKMHLSTEMPRLINDVKMGLDIECPIGLTSKIDATVNTHQEMLEASIRIISRNAKQALADASKDVARINITLGASDVIKNGVYIGIADNGVGMTQETLNKALLPFFTTRKAAEGIGLGLTIVNNFVHHQQGKLVIRSELGSGTEVAMHLPLADQ